MDLTRLLLIIAIAAVGYILILKWNEDFGQLSPQTTPIQTPVTSDEKPAIGTLPAATDEPSVADVPSVTPQETSAAPDTKQLISIKTDVLNVLVDPRGGDIVSVNLPQYPISLDHPDIPFALLEHSQQRVYTTQSGLLGKNGPDDPKNNPKRPIYATTAQTYTLENNQNELIVDLTLHPSSEITIVKRLRFLRGNYAIKQEMIIDNKSAEPWEGQFFAEIKRDSSADPALLGAASFSTYLGFAFHTNEENYRKVKFKTIQESPFQANVNGGWVALVQHYFLTAWIPDPNQQYFYQTRYSGNYYFGGFVGPKIVVPANSNQTVATQFYAGPKIQKQLSELAPGLELTVDYGWLWFLAKPLFWLLNFCHQLVGNWGIAIIILTFLVKLVFFKLSATSYKSMANMRKLQPKLTQLRERYAGDRQKLATEMMAMYRKEKINPMGGCLPILVQMPVFIALYWVLLESVELRQAPFFGWIQDLSLKDPYFILPLLMGGTMFLQTSLNPSPPDPMQARVMKMMPIIFTFLFLWFPAGLVLYWLVNNILSITQQWIITRTVDQTSSKKS